ncbi:MAG: hypothetical protein ACLQPH_16695 [Acidimicrobiales bacterium]
MASKRQLARTLGSGGLLAAAASVALALAGPDALVPFKDAAGAATEVSVGFVLDFGPSGQVVSGCVKVPSSDNGYDALAAFAAQELEAAPTYNASGLLCSINGVPASGCGQGDGDKYIYWSYFHGVEGHPWTWQYSSSGAFAPVGTWNGQADDVEGWRFQDPGTGLPNDPPPRGASDYADLCGSGTTTTTTTVAPVATTGHPARSRAQKAVAWSHSRATAATGTGQTVPPTRTAAASPSSTPSTDEAPLSTAGSSGTGAHAGGGSVTSTPPTAFPDEQAQSLRATASPDGGGPGFDPVPLVVGGLLVMALAAGALFRWRRRPGAP